MKKSIRKRIAPFRSAPLAVAILIINGFLNNCTASPLGDVLVSINGEPYYISVIETSFEDNEELLSNQPWYGVWTAETGIPSGDYFAALESQAIDIANQFYINNEYRSMVSFENYLAFTKIYSGSINPDIYSVRVNGADWTGCGSNGFCYDWGGIEQGEVKYYLYAKSVPEIDGKSSGRLAFLFGFALLALKSWRYRTDDC